MRFDVTVKKYLGERGLKKMYRGIEVEANTEEEAMEKAKPELRHGEIVCFAEVMEAELRK